MMLQREKSTAEAKDEAYQLNEEYPRFLSVPDLLARIHEDAGEFQKAIELLERVSSITSATNTDRLRKIAEVAEVAGDREKVISTLKARGRAHAAIVDAEGRRLPVADAQPARRATRR